MILDTFSCPYRAPADFICIRVRNDLREVHALIDAGASLFLCSAATATVANCRNLTLLCSGIYRIPRANREIFASSTAEQGRRMFWCVIFPARVSPSDQWPINSPTNSNDRSRRCWRQGRYNPLSARIRVIGFVFNSYMFISN